MSGSGQVLVRFLPYTANTLLAMNKVMHQAILKTALNLSTIDNARVSSRFSIAVKMRAQSNKRYKLTLSALIVTLHQIQLGHLK